MGDAENSATETSLNQVQLEDLAWLLAETRNVDDLERFADRFLGAGEARKAGANEVNDPHAFALKIVEEWRQKKHIADVVEVLMSDGHPSGPMRIGLNRILDGERVNTSERLQALLNKYEAFLSTADMIDLLPKVARQVCAVALGDPRYEFRGSGFLIAPDVVLTNYHVIEPALPKDKDTGEFTPTMSGDQIFFFFDYMRAPQPKVPPADNGRGTICVTAAEDWYVYARDKLAYDGMKNCPAEIKNNELDYALIKLARPLGELSARVGGGAVRGWLQLQDSVDLDSKKTKKILVVQHPGAQPQLFDMGEYTGTDRSGTRVWYSVNTAEGSSGGAAIRTDGRLFALHNAEVESDKENGEKRVNQGVRIDLITKDIGDKVKLETPPDEKKLLWSLIDNFQNPQPIIGRSKFRDYVTQMNRSTTDRVLEVRGTPPVGLSFSIKLLDRMRPQDARVVVFSKELKKEAHEGFVPKLVTQLGISGYAGEMPQLLKTESPNRWIPDVGKWLLDAIAKDHEMNKTKYPAWIVINTVVDKDDTFVWGAQLEDLIATLLGRRNDQNEALDIPELRWLFLATPQTSLPLAGIKRLEENLDNDSKYDEDFEACYLNAYRSIDKKVPMEQKNLRPFALDKLEDEEEKPNPKPPRKVLALYIRRLLKLAQAVEQSQ